MATIKALEGRTVHQIQSGQVIVDLCSVVKELVENSLDAGATSIDVRFKNNGLEAIEVQDNGIGISSESYETIALKHYTSKLSSYDDLTSLHTFGFRGEALSSLCALSDFHIVTAQADDAPRGKRLDFEVSGQLKETQVVASQKGTTVAVENLFMNLPVRRRELEKNIKREYGKVLGVLQSYACISTQARISVSNVMAKGKKAVVFATRSNQTTRDNIANVFGAKALSGLIAMNLSYEMQPTKSRIQGWTTQADTENKQVRVIGHVSRPIFGEGRQAPDRQMFFVNTRPCSLPQVAKVFNEVYKSYNLSQSPFVFANIVLDTNAYDVNVSPDKRTILLHDQNTLLETLKTSLIELFEKQEQTVPQTQQQIPKLPFKQLTLHREASTTDESDVYYTGQDLKSSEDGPSQATDEGDKSVASSNETQNERAPSLIAKFAERHTRDPFHKSINTMTAEKDSSALLKDKRKLVKKLGGADNVPQPNDEYSEAQDTLEPKIVAKDRPVMDFNQRLAEQQAAVATRQQLSGSEDEEEIAVSQPSVATSSPGVVQAAYDRMRPRRDPVEVATITIGSKTTTSPLRPVSAKKRKIEATSSATPRARVSAKSFSTQAFSSSMKAFVAPGTQAKALIDVQQDELDAYEREATGSASEPEADESAEGTGSGEEQSVQEDADGAVLENFEAKCDAAGAESSADTNAETFDGDYVDEESQKAREDARVAGLIQLAENKSAAPSRNDNKRASHLLKGGGQKDSTTALIQIIQTSVERINDQMRSLQKAMQDVAQQTYQEPAGPIGEDSPEARLSLIVSKNDFSGMHIIGQFNLGFILALRPSHSPSQNGNQTSNTPKAAVSDELFIIDQHASDEKINFERLQRTTTLQNQRLVHPKPLALTAIEEEIILENSPTLVRNGFVVAIDTSGDKPVGGRCSLLSLPMSKEVTFDLSDLEELIALLAESPQLPAINSFTMEQYVARPSKTRRLFAMRACRSSIMIGRPLSRSQMERLVRRMGKIEKPWNCPHGRPTMRHVLSLAGWEGWTEGDGVVGLEHQQPDRGCDWKEFIRGVREPEEEDGDGDDDDEDEEEDQEASSEEPQR